MAWKKIAGVGVAAAAGAGLLIAAVNPASAAASYPDKAFGAQIQLNGDDVLKATPFAAAPDGKLVKKRIVSVPSRDWQPTVALPLIGNDTPADIGVLQAQAEKNRAEAKIARVNLGGNGGITAKLIQAKSANAKGSTHIVNLKIAGNDMSGLVADPAPNTTIGVPGLLEVTFNEQMKNSDGSLTVNAVHVEVVPGLSTSQLGQLSDALDAAGGLKASAGLTKLGSLDSLTNTQRNSLSTLKTSAAKKQQARQAKSDALLDVILASATSGNKADTPPGDGGNEPPGDGGNAPTPTPVPTQHPVTG